LVGEEIFKKKKRKPRGKKAKIGFSGRSDAERVLLAKKGCGNVVWDRPKKKA